MARPDPPLHREVPEGYELVAVEEAPRWRADDTRHCRWTMPDRKACGRPSVAALNRKRYLRGLSAKVDQWWGYCGDHLYGHWIEDGKVMVWILREKPDA